jgi:hypothetical protein
MSHQVSQSLRFAQLSSHNLFVQSSGAFGPQSHKPTWLGMQMPSLPQHQPHTRAVAPADEDVTGLGLRTRLGRLKLTPSPSRSGSRSQQQQQAHYNGSLFDSGHKR